MPNKYYYKDGSILACHDTDKILHRLDGPAIEYEDGTKYWFQNGQLHRLDGPAIERSDGTKEYWIHGKHVPSLPVFHKFDIDPIKTQQKRFMALEI